MRAVLLTLALLTPAPAAPPPRPGPPPPPREALLAFEEAQGYLRRARAVTGALEPGAVLVQDTPAGRRLVVPLEFSGRTVARAFVTTGGDLVPRGGERALPGAGVPTLGAQARARLAAQVAGLTLSSFARVVGPQVHCYLLSGTQVVAELHFDRRSGQLLEDRGPPARPGPAPPSPRP
ncbi:hypothetical protein [Deinococcus aetherius]|uniref:hypothetical protein n=1 Tax=Deinococcus aetherius TaxID=200252 RepID=UPI00222F90B9|nr:hypothetical protein [Deinococcus aetherius]